MIIRRRKTKRGISAESVMKSDKILGFGYFSGKMTEEWDGIREEVVAG